MKPLLRSNVFALILITFLVFTKLFVSSPLVRLFGYSNFMLGDEYILILIPCILFFIITKAPVKKTLRLNKLSFTNALLIIVIAILCQPISSFLANLAGIIFPNPVPEALSSMGNVSFLFMFFAIAVQPAICEEAFCRGVVLSGYENQSTAKAAVINGLIFGMFHLDLNQFFYAFALGIIFTYLVRITNSIFASSLAHVTFNGIQVALSFAVLKNYDSETVKQAQHQTSSQIILTLGVLFVMAAACLFLVIMILQYMDKQNKKNMPEETAPAFNFEQDPEMMYMLNNPIGDVEINEEGITSYIPLWILIGEFSVLMYLAYVVVPKLN
ncbi:CPBP family intramembrane metalloprotease [Clostridium sp. 19966]|uniref:CPBP family intramembrane glutamic endopeptidase n=1 Tax=Clostridium sp. 19966 TaxID=2768166 RepID=UPI0028DE7F12|nr:type II CAAX endopeptidase family protein [Clostridium sp. 19966]MDT8719428.1 CPBP family intramembrane metalloprotease [Clostridium sp. 19966]